MTNSMIPARKEFADMSLKDAMRTLAATASPSRRRLFALTVALMLVGAFAELATIGAVLPFLALVTAPERAQDYPQLIALGERFGGGQAGIVLAGAALLITVAIVAGVVRLALTWVNLRFILLYGHDVGVTIFGRLLRQPYNDFVTRNSSVALSSIDKLNSVVFGVLMPLMQGAAAAVISVFIVVGLLIIDPVAASMAAFSLGFTYIAVSLLTRARLGRNASTLGAASTERVKVVQEGLGGLRDILIDDSQVVYEQAFAQLDYRYRSALVVNNMIALAPRFLVETAVIVMIAVITVYFAQSPGGLIAAVPVLGALAIGAQRLLPLVHLAYNGWAAFAGSSQLIIDIAQLLRIPVLKSAGGPKRALPLPFANEILINDVCFQYQEGEPALRGVSLAIKKGERIGFVGKTGSGKSTLIDLLMGLLPAKHGEIRIDGTKLDEDTVANWQAQIAHVPQSIYLSDGTIASNIAFGVAREEIDMDRVVEAARGADIDSFIARQPGAYDATVGERGVRLSGGQRQRIGIARALYKGADVLVFDEATSALDENTESAIMESIYRLDRNVTLLMIAHRVSTLSGCDRIIRLAEGRIVEIEKA
ncbi:ABC transporter ATP-binding protein [Novosphingopyxis sp. YJ-S2-01]|uniref:ABC transporter ATP-binding protein n=1 Tax=Novosphingopyxis sp. YJ-S2-01 TaxID=2794021 RepID=UPI0018DC8E4C|nr:ABC transporter ATP-binding protein [Novosphingopyxis sp. YJ-S2-01]MBH9538450.1 ABC transporter ATP-binding protein [Novosphingopyxis sp. YJ-S2-01]